MKRIFRSHLDFAEHFARHAARWAPLAGLLSMGLPLGCGGPADESEEVAAVQQGLASVPHTVPTLSAGFGHTCALRQNGTVGCWGWNDAGQLGDGTTTDRRLSVDVLDADGTPLQHVIDLAAGGAHAGGAHNCALVKPPGQPRSIKCWGRNDQGQLGNENFINQPRAVTVSVLPTGPGLQPMQITVGRVHSCALLENGEVHCWGGNDRAQIGWNHFTSAPEEGLPTFPVSGLADAVQIDASWDHTCAVRSNGTVRCWGANESHQSNVPSGLSNAVQVSAGNHHSCARLSTGGVRCWGTMTGSGLPAGEISGLSQVATITSGSHHMCAVEVDTTGNHVTKCMGQNGNGQLGDGSTTHRNTPVIVRGAQEGVAQISGGGNHTCALFQSGEVGCWGLNGVGQLGDGMSVSSTPNVAIAGWVTSPTPAIAAGGDHSCVILPYGGVKCWGSGSLVGDGTTITRTTPTIIPELQSGVQQLALGVGHSCALMSGGVVRCWGENGYGQLGDGTTSVRRSPVLVKGLADAAVAITVGDAHSCALLRNDTIQCWGSHASGQLGIGGTTGTGAGSLTPVTITHAHVRDIRAIDAGGSHTCAIVAGRPDKPNGTVFCWGAGLGGQLGNGGATMRSTPVEVVGLPPGVSVEQITLGARNSCARLGDGRAFCWGDTLGNGSPLGNASTVPVQVVGLGNTVLSLTAGDLHVCALRSDPEHPNAQPQLWCWGQNWGGQLGTSSSNAESPIRILWPGPGVKQLAGGRFHTCAILTDDSYSCWGWGMSGQIGNGSLEGTSFPAKVGNLWSNIVAAAAGHQHTCALNSDGEVKCWGTNNYGQLGYGEMTPDLQATPPQEASLGGVQAITAGGHHTCALMNNGNVRCWGRNDAGQLGVADATSQPSPTVVPGLAGDTVVAISAGESHTCALLDDTTVKCWGLNQAGQLGDTTHTSRFEPELVTGVGGTGVLENVTSISAGRIHTCARLSSGSSVCWGDNLSGQLGNGTSSSTGTPYPVASGSLTEVTDLDAGGWNTCAVTMSPGTVGRVSCWGAPTGSTPFTSIHPKQIPSLFHASSVVSGRDTTCVLLTNGTSKCWGTSGHFGDRGAPSSGRNDFPNSVNGLPVPATSLASGMWHSCAVLNTGDLACWGHNTWGQIGDGGSGWPSNRNRPVVVSF